jgi:hypothetical protein
MASTDPTSGCPSGSRPRCQEPAAPTATAGEVVAPAKTLRLLGALDAGLDELNRVGLDDAARGRVITAHRAALIEVASTVSDALIDELVRLRVAPLDQEASVDQIKVAQAQLLGWVSGLVLAEANVSPPALVGHPTFEEGP